MGVPFIQAVQRRTAVVAIAPSTVRKQGPGVVRAASGFLTDLPLLPFATADVVAKGLAHHAAEGNHPALPKWKGVKYLTQPDSVRYQAFAAVLARSWQPDPIPRVHLDTYLWVEGREES